MGAAIFAVVLLTVSLTVQSAPAGMKVLNSYHDTCSYEGKRQLDNRQSRQ